MRAERRVMVSILEARVRGAAKQGGGFEVLEIGVPVPAIQILIHNQYNDGNCKSIDIWTIIVQSSF